jgi:ion channel POLLUX/CASTOR
LYEKNILKNRMENKKTHGQDSYIPIEKKENEDSNNRSLSKLLRYNFDNSISKGSNFIIYLILFSFLCGILMTLFQFLTDTSVEGSFFDKWWESITKILDVGEGETGKERFVEFLFWALSIAFSGAVIGFLTSKITAVIESLKKGKSNVIALDHIIIIGWSENINAVLKELSLANENVRGQQVVIFSSLQNEIMQENVALIKNDLKNLKIITRSGDSTRPEELKILNLNRAKSIIILNQNSDSEVITTLLSIITLLHNKTANIIASLRDRSYSSAIESIEGYNIIPVMANEITAEVTAQVLRFRGLGLVILDFLDFDGDEIYFTEPSELIGKSYLDALLMFDESSLIGLKDNAGDIILSPTGDTIIEEGVKLIVISEDDSTIKIQQKPNLKADAVVDKTFISDGTPKNVLFIGWSAMGVNILDSYIHFLSRESIIDIAYLKQQVDPDILGFKNEIISTNFIAIKNETKDIIDLLNSKAYDEVVILSNTHVLSIDEADTSTLLKMLLIDTNREKIKYNKFRVVSQILDSSKARLAEATFSEEIVVSDNLAALYISQLIENSHLKKVFEEIFSATGASINIYPVTKYIDLSDPNVTYSQLVISAGMRNESAIGLRLGGENLTSQKQGVILNPEKSREFMLSEEDQLLVISR